MEDKTLKFKAWLVERGIKQSEIAELLNINLTNVNEKLNGKQPFTLEQIKTICGQYDLSADEYFI